MGYLLDGRWKDGWCDTGRAGGDFVRPHGVSSWAVPKDCNRMPRQSLEVENLFLRRELALYRERGVEAESALASRRGYLAGLVLPAL